MTVPGNTDSSDADFTNAAAPPTDIPGLVYVREFLTEEEAEHLWQTIDAQTWSDALQRRTQHYGYVYDYRKRTVNLEMFLGDLPGWAAELAERLHQQQLMPTIADQLIVNEYEPGQGIAQHVDCEPCFQNTICSLSLGSPCIMDLCNLESPEQRSILLEPRSALILSGEARYDWSHGIARRDYDMIDGEKRPRSRRISLTLRNVILNN